MAIRRVQFPLQGVCVMPVAPSPWLCPSWWSLVS